MYGSSYTLICLLSPVFTALLLIFVSGIPLLQKMHDKQYGDTPEYKTYVQNTSKLIPGLF